MVHPAVGANDLVGVFRVADELIPAFAFDLAVTVRPRLDIVASLEKSRSVNPSEYRDWVDNNDQPIEQVTKFERMPLVLSARYYLTERGRRNDQIILVGGAPLNQEFGDAIGADAYCRDAAVASEMAKQLVSARRGNPEPAGPSVHA